MPGTQTRRKRRLGQFLLGLREARGVKHEDVAEMLRKSQSSISKMETGQNLCSFSELGAMLAFYDATDDQRREAQTMWDDASIDSTRIQVPSGHPRKYRSYVRSEADAESVRLMGQLVVPGLLQTLDYARAIHAVGNSPAAQPRRAVDSRSERQSRLQGDDPLQLHALLDEAVLSRLVGGPSVMRDQLWRLLELAEQDNITMQIVPFEAGAYGSSSGPMVILGFRDGESPDAVYLEYPGGGEWVDNEGDVQVAADLFTEAVGQALTPWESIDVMRDRARELSAE